MRMPRNPMRKTVAYRSNTGAVSAFGAQVVRRDGRYRNEKQVHLVPSTRPQKSHTMRVTDNVRNRARAEFFFDFAHMIAHGAHR